MSSAARRLVPIVAGVLTGVLSILPYPDIGWLPVAPLAYLPLLLAMPILSWRGALFAGWIAGAVSLAGIFHWIVPTAVNLAQFPAWGAAGVLVAYSLAYGLNCAALALALRAILGLAIPAWGRVLLAPAAVVAVDFLGPHLFPFTIGNTYWRVPLLIQGAEITGIEGATFATLAVTTAMALAIRDRWAGRRVGIAGPVVALVVATAWIGYGAVRLPVVREAEASAPTVRLLVVQPDVRPEERRSRDAAVKDGLLARQIAMTGEALQADAAAGAHPPVDAVIWPEGSFPWEWVAPKGPATGGSRAIARLRDAVRGWGVPLVFGSITRPEQRGRNSMILLGPDGVERDRYDKRRLLAFGEYLPLSETFPTLKGRIPGVGNLEEGKEFAAFRVGGHVAAPSICYEAVQAGLTREAVVAVDADLILNVTNDGWFGTSGAPAQHLMDQVPRAVELRRPLVRTTMTGISGVIRASGDLTDETGVYERATEFVTVPLPPEGATPFVVAGRTFPWTCVGATVAALLAAAWAYRKGKKSRSTITG